MRLSVDHVTLYTYDRPVRGVVQSHRLMPSQFDGQQMLDWSVSVSGGARGGSFRDAAGDFVQSWSIKGPVTQIEVHVQGKVETTDLAGVLKGHRETVPPLAYLRTTLATAPDTAIKKLSRVGSTGQRNIFDLRCSERTHNVTNWSPWIVACTKG